MGSGYFGVVCKVHDTLETGVKPKAAKIEPIKNSARGIPMEKHIYRAIHDITETTNGYARMHFYGTFMDHHVLVMDQLGPSLYQKIRRRKRRMFIGEVHGIAVQALTRLKFLHERGFLHCDIKPDNFVYGVPDGNDAFTLHLIDFGLSQKYRDEETGAHTPECSGERFLGTMRFASRHVHMGITYSRRDDLESLAYMLIYIATETLPWDIQCNQPEIDDAIEEAILEEKQKPAARLCVGLPLEFQKFTDYVRGLSYAAEPDYNSTILMFMTALCKLREERVERNGCDPEIEEAVDLMRLGMASKAAVPQKRARPEKQADGSLNRPLQNRRKRTHTLEDSSQFSF